MTPDNETKHLIVGTAGHVDHGKTTLIKAMTGTNTDRLKEEQERGLTIDLGFASLKLPSGRQVGIVDVPGHERFLKNMLAGASGVDIALLVVAADEGVMPQTREHLEILELLETRQGVVALTKSDMVDEEWIEIVEDDLREYLSKTFLRNAKIIRVSGVTRLGIDDLEQEIDRLADEAQQRTIEGPFRLPIDRVFTMTGFGTVVTGTLVSGILKLGDPAVILPEQIESRIRQLQVHGVKQEVVYAGSRVAVNLAGIDVPDIERGSVLVPPGYLQGTNTVEAYVRVLEQAARPLRNRMRVRLHVGTSEVIGRATVLGAEEIAPGENGFILLKLESEVVAARGDRYVLRFYSPTSVMGGGIILDPIAAKHKRSDQAAIERLQRRLKGDPADMVEDALSLSETGLMKPELVRRTGLTELEVNAAICELIENARVIETSGRLFQRVSFEMTASRIRSALETYHKTNAIKPGMPREDLKAEIGSRFDQKGYQSILAMLSSRNEIVISEAVVRLPDHKPTLTPQQEKLADAIENEYKSAGANPPLIDEIEQRHGAGFREIIALLVERGDLIKITNDLYFHSKAISEAEAALRKYLEENQQITVSQFRDMIGSSRKYVVPLLEYFDLKRVTRRLGDQRVLFK